MLMGAIWTGMLIVSIFYSIISGNTDAAAQAAMEGAQQAVTLCLDIGGIMCLWCAVMELMSECGMAQALARALTPVLGRLFPESKGRAAVMEPLAANVSANLLGLGNAATPMGIRAACAMAERCENGVASDELCRLVVLNTASIQFIPTTVAAVRAAEGAAAPFDILPEVWISSLISVAVGLLAARLFAAMSR